MATIQVPLSSRKYPGLFALIDEEDFPLVSRHKWCPVLKRGAFYAMTTLYDAGGHRTRNTYLSRLLIGDACTGHFVDHRNHDTLDNTRGNLRIATHLENGRNREQAATSRRPYRGVRQEKGGHWSATVHIGGFVTAEDAARALDRIDAELVGDFANPRIHG